MAISNKYKNTLDDFINSLDKKLPDWLRLIDKRLRNACKSKSSSIGLSKGNCHINSEDVLDTLLELVSKT